MKRLLAIMLMLLVCLTGCSSNKGYGPTDSITAEWKDGVIWLKNAATCASSYDGTSAIGKTPDGIEVKLTIDTAKDVTNISCNTQNILEENMDKYKDAFYYLEYLGTSFTMAKEIGADTWSVGKAYCGNTAATLIATNAYNVMEQIPLTNMPIYCDFGKFVVGTEYDHLIIDNEGCHIDGILKVVKKQYDKGNPYSVMVGEQTISMLKSETEKYDYYSYDGYLIQMSKGLDVSYYVKFKAEEK